MKILTLLEDFLIEISPEEIHKTYYSKIPYKVFYGLVTADPQTIVDGGKIKKIGRYAKILISFWQHNQLKYEDFPKAKEYLTYVYKHNIPIPQNVRNLNDIYDLVQHYIVQDNPNFKTAIGNLNQNEYNIVFNGKDWIIYKPLTERAACYLGVNTEWCTTWGPLSLNPSHYDRTNRYLYYTQNTQPDPLYIIVNKDRDEEKYQFHFKTKQFMDINDKQVNVRNFFSDRSEIRDFFFPSFIKNVSEKELREEMERMSVLSNEDRLEIIRKLTEITSENNSLVVGILNEDHKIVEEFIHGKQLEDINFYNNNLEVKLTKIGHSLDQAYDTLGYYRSELNGGSDTLYYDLDGIEWDDELLPVFIVYYDENKELIKTSVAIHNFETFKEQFFDNFYNDDKIQDGYRDKYIDLTDPNYNDAIREYINEITDYIDISSTYSGSYEVSINPEKLITYLLERDINSIDDISKFLNQYIDDENIPIEYESVEYDRSYPTYKEIENLIDSYFENLFENVEECTGYREIYNNVITKIFGGDTNYENEHVKIKINSPQINCDDGGTVSIDYWNKDKGTHHRGNVKVSNLSNYALNYSLFESIRLFKKNIL